MSVRYQIAGRKAAEIAASVEAGVRSGALGPGAVLPPVRTLAVELGVAPATVASAYQGLRSRGLVETAGRNGTRVRQRPPVALPQSGGRGSRPVPSGRVDSGVGLPPGVVDLSTGEPDPALLPPLGPRLLRLAESASDPVGYRNAGPWPELVRLGRERLRTDGVPADDVAVTVTSGALDAMERLLTTHLRPGDRVGVEDPGWANLIDLVAALGLYAVPVPVDSEGPTVDGLRQALHAGVGALVITSRAHNPTGAAVSARRVAALRRILAPCPDVLVIEDDHAAELADVPLATLAGACERWAFVRSVSKPYGPDLRVAVVAGDETSIARVEGRLRLGAGWVSTVLQRLVVELWRDDAVADLVAHARVEYANRRVALLAALAERGVLAYGRAGINVWIPVVDEATVVAGVRDEGWAVSPGSRYRLNSQPGVRVTVGVLDVSQVDDVAEALARCVNGELSRAGRGR